MNLSIPRGVALLAALCLVFALGVSGFAASFPANGFSDVSRSAWYAEAVDFVKASGLMNGVGGNRFDPNGTVTRGQMVMMLWRVAGKPVLEAAECPYKDVSEDSVFLDAVMWAAQEGIAGGATADT